MPNAYNLTTKAQVKTHLQISGNADDTFIDTLCDGVTAFIETLLGGQRIFATEHENEIHDGDMGAFIRLQHKHIYEDFDLVVETNGGSNASPNWQELSADSYDVYPDSGVIKLKEKIGGRRNIRITYKAGWSTIPAEIALIATTIVGRVYNRRRSLGLAGETFEGVGQTWADSMTSDEQAIIDTYKHKLV